MRLKRECPSCKIDHVREDPICILCTAIGMMDEHVDKLLEERTAENYQHNSINLYWDEAPLKRESG